MLSAGLGFPETTGQGKNSRQPRQGRAPCPGEGGAGSLGAGGPRTSVHFPGAKMFPSSVLSQGPPSDTCHVGKAPAQWPAQLVWAPGAARTRPPLSRVMPLEAGCGWRVFPRPPTSPPASTCHILSPAWEEDEDPDTQAGPFLHRGAEHLRITRRLPWCLVLFSFCLS